MACTWTSGNLTGWAGPGGEAVDPAWFRIVRGRPGLIERAVFEVPERAGFRVSDVTIGGVPISVGGQLSEHMTMKLVGLASEPGKFSDKPVGCAAGCCADAANPAFLYYRSLGRPCPRGRVSAFDYPAPEAPTAAAAQTVPIERSSERPHRTRYPFNRSR